MRCQEGGEEDDPPLVPRLGTRTGSTILFSTTTRFCDMKQKRNYSFLTSRSIAKTSYTIRSSGVLLQTGRVFLMTFIVGVKSYMEVSNETSDGFGTVNAIDFLFSNIHDTPFLYVNLCFGVLHKLRADVTRPDYPWSSKLPHLQVGASNSFQIQSVRRGLLSFSVR